MVGSTPESLSKQYWPLAIIIDWLGGAPGMPPGAGPGGTAAPVPEAPGSAGPVPPAGGTIVPRPALPEAVVGGKLAPVPAGSGGGATLAPMRGPSEDEPPH